MSSNPKSKQSHPGSSILKALVMISAGLTFAVLIFLIAFIIIKGVGYLKPSLFSFTYNSDNVSLFPAAVNTVIMTVLTLLIAVPIGVFAAIFLVEYSGKGSPVVKVIRMTAETPFDCLWTFRYDVFCDNLKMGPVDFIRFFYHGNYDSSIDYANNGRSPESRSGYLPGSKLRPWRRQASDNLQNRSSGRSTRNSCRSYSCHRTYCRGNGSADVHSRHGGSDSVQPFWLGTYTGRSYVCAFQ